MCGKTIVLKTGEIKEIIKVYLNYMGLIEAK